MLISSGTLLLPELSLMSVRILPADSTGGAMFAFTDADCVILITLSAISVLAVLTPILVPASIRLPASGTASGTLL